MDDEAAVAAAKVTLAEALKREPFISRIIGANVYGDLLCTVIKAALDSRDSTRDVVIELL